MYTKDNNKIQPAQGMRKNETDEFSSSSAKRSESATGYEVAEDTETKKWNVYPLSYFSGTSEKWVVEFRSKDEAYAFRKNLLDGTFKSPADAPSGYGIPRKGSRANTMIYTKF